MVPSLLGIVLMVGGIFLMWLGLNGNDLLPVTKQTPLAPTNDTRSAVGAAGNVQ